MDAVLPLAVHAARQAVMLETVFVFLATLEGVDAVGKFLNVGADGGGEVVDA
jgi:hypothetical protein